MKNTHTHPPGLRRDNRAHEAGGAGRGVPGAGAGAGGDAGRGGVGGLSDKCGVLRGGEGVEGSREVVEGWGEY